MNYIKSLFTLFLLVNLISCTSEKESIIISKLSNKDEQQITYYKNIALKNMQGNYDLSLIYIDSMINFSIQKKYPKGEASAYYYKGVIHDIKSNFDSSLESFKKMYAIAVENSMDGMIARASGLLGNTFIRKAKYQQGLAFLFKEIEILKKSKEQWRLGNTHLSIASAYRIQQEFDLAIKHGTKSLDFLSPNNVELLGLRGGTYRTLGLAYFEKEMFDSSKVCLDSAYYYYQKRRGKEGKIKFNYHFEMSNLSSAYAAFHVKKNELKKAIANYKESIEYAKHPTVNSDLFIGAALSDMGAIYNELGSFKKSIQVTNEALLTLETSQDISLLALCYSNLAKSYLEQKEYQKALDFIQTGLSKSIANGMYKDILEKSAESHNENIYECFILLERQTEILYKKYQESKQLKDLQDCIQIANMAIRILDKYKFSLSSEKSQLTLAKNKFEIFESAIKASQTLYNITRDKSFFKQALIFSEYAKAKILYTKVIRLHKSRINDFSQQFSALSKNVEQGIEIYEKQIANSDSLLRKKLHIDFEDNISNIHKELSGRALIEYFSGEKEIFVFLMSENQDTIFSIPKNDHFSSQLEKYRRSLSTFDKDLSNLPKFINSATFLFNQLLKPIYKDIVGKDLITGITHPENFEI